MASKARGGNVGTGCEAGILFTHSGKNRRRYPVRLLYADQVVE